MQLEVVFEELKIEKAYFPAVAADWEKSELSFPGTSPYFMKREFYEKYYAMSGAGHDLLALMDQAAAVVESSPAAQHLAWHCHKALCFYEVRRFDEWPELDTFLWNNRGIFYLLIWLSAFPEWIKTYKQLGIPEEYAIAAGESIDGAIYIYQAAHDGHPGLNRKQLHWCRWYIEGKVFRVGRFEYMYREFNKNYPAVYRHKATKQIVAICNSGWLLDKNGFRLCDGQKKEDAWRISELIETEDRIRGIPISPAGYALPEEKLELPASEWENVFHEGDGVLDVHIPGGGKMTLEACEKSFADAISFYRKYFPDKKVKAFFSVSWIFNPQFEEELPKSNLARFMKQLYLFPWPSNGLDGLFFIFGREDDNWREYPADNSIRIAMLNILKSGRRLKTGGMFFLTGHIDKFGEEYYRNNHK